MLHAVPTSDGHHIVASVGNQPVAFAPAYALQDIDPGG